MKGPSKRQRPVGRWLLIPLGGVFVALGVAGMLLPVMPTTVFMLLALACFSRGSPTLANALLQHRWLGAPLRHWQANRCIPPRVRWIACLSMAGGFLWLASRDVATQALCMACVLILLGMASVLLLPSTPHCAHQRWVRRVPACLPPLSAFCLLAGWLICQRPLV